MPASADPASNRHFRLFIAAAVPKEIKGAIGEALAELRHAFSDEAVRWTRLEQVHLTLRFLGDVAAPRVEALVDAARGACGPFAPLRLRAARLGFFPDARFPRVMWVGVQGPGNQLSLLQRAVQDATQPFTSEPPETEFTGHISLARFKGLRRLQVEALARLAAAFADRDFGEWTAGQIELLRSDLSPQGARHSLLAALPLTGGSSPALHAHE